MGLCTAGFVLKWKRNLQTHPLYSIHNNLRLYLMYSSEYSVYIDIGKPFPISMVFRFNNVINMSTSHGLLSNWYLIMPI